VPRLEGSHGLFQLQAPDLPQLLFEALFIVIAAETAGDT
jgi:hypothetical protein